MRRRAVTHAGDALCLRVLLHVLRPKLGPAGMFYKTNQKMETRRSGGRREGERAYRKTKKELGARFGLATPPAAALCLPEALNLRRAAHANGDQLVGATP